MTNVAIIETGGKQYLVREGEEFLVERLAAEPDQTITVPDHLHGGKVTLVVIAAERAPKVLIRKFKAKVNYLRRRGHRQLLTRVRVKAIQTQTKTKGKE